MTASDAAGGARDVPGPERAADGRTANSIPGRHRCPICGRATTYQAFSGGREWYCESCDTTGEYPDGEAPRRVAMLQSPEGVAQLRQEMRAELDPRRGARPPVDSDDAVSAPQTESGPRDVQASGEPADGRTAVPGCPHCPDGHTPPDGGSQPWAVWVGAACDGDGQPITIHVARSGGAHVAESDAEWIRKRLNTTPNP